VRQPPKKFHNNLSTSLSIQNLHNCPYHAMGKVSWICTLCWITTESNQSLLPSKKFIHIRPQLSQLSCCQTDRQTQIKTISLAEVITIHRVSEKSRPQKRLSFSVGKKKTDRQVKTRYICRLTWQLLCPAPNRRGIKRWCCLTSVSCIHRA